MVQKSVSNDQKISTLVIVVVRKEEYHWLGHLFLRLVEISKIWGFFYDYLNELN